MTHIECPGLDGSNPLHFLASLGVLRVGTARRFIRSMSWKHAGHWFPQYHFESEMDLGSLCQELVEFVVSRKVSAFREKMDVLNSELTEIIQSEHLLKSGMPQADRSEKSKTSADRKILASRKARIKSRLQRMAPFTEPKPSAAVLPSYALRQVYMRFPIVTKAQHLDDVLKEGLSEREFRAESAELLGGNSPSGVDLSGIAATAVIKEKRQSKWVEYIARTHFSFANNNSGKQLLKDFASAAALCTATRIESALQEVTQNFDDITGLGWDPASQKSYALQFANPQDDVRSQVAMNALAFIGLSEFCVCPLSEGRGTVGFSRIRENSAATSSKTLSEDEDEADGDEPKGAFRDMFSWPVWTFEATESVIRAMIGMSLLHSDQPDALDLARRGVAEAFRSRRFSANKRSFFAPSRSL